MGLLDFLSNSSSKDQDLAKNGFEKAATTAGDSKELRALRIRVALRCKTGLDIIFRRAMQAVSSYEETVMIATAGGESAPPLPAAGIDDCYQTTSTVNGPVTIYVPHEFASKFFDLGVRFQKKEIDKVQTILEGQEIANELGSALQLDQYLVQPITPLEFLATGDDPETSTGD